MAAFRDYRDFCPRPRLWQALALSPDGQRIAFVDDESGQFNLAVQAVTGQRRALTRFTDRTVRAVHWHPDGTRLVFLADEGGTERTQVYLISASTGDAAVPAGTAQAPTPGVPAGTAQALTAAVAAQHHLADGNPFSPDGRLLAYAGNDRVAHDQDVLVRDLSTGGVRRVWAAGGPAWPGHWSPDGTRLSMALRPDPHNDHAVYLLDPHGADPPRRLGQAGDPATYRLGPWLPDGSGFLVISNQGRDTAGLAVMDAGSGALRWIDTPRWDVEDAALSTDGNVLVWTVNVDGCSVLRARDMRTAAAIAVPALPRGQAAALNVSADGRRAAVLLTTPTRPWDAAVIELGTGRWRWVTDSVPPGARETALVQPELVRIASAEGHHIPTLVYRPPGQGPFPAVLSIHGGPIAQQRPGYGDGFTQFLVRRGVGVVAPNIRGSSGYGSGYQNRIYRDWGGCDLHDLATVSAWLRGRDWVDPGRIGVRGGSYGGFAALSCVSRLPQVRWAAAVSIFGPGDLVTLASRCPPTWRSFVDAMLGDPDRVPADRERLRHRSPASHADAIRTPLFLVQGENDPRVPRQGGDTIALALARRGVPVRYRVFPNEGHGFTRRADQERVLSEEAEFLLHHLGAP